MKQRKVIEGSKYTRAYLTGFDAGKNGVDNENYFTGLDTLALCQWLSGYNAALKDKARIKIQAVKPKLNAV